MPYKREIFEKAQDILDKRRNQAEAKNTAGASFADRTFLSSVAFNTWLVPMPVVFNNL